MKTEKPNHKQIILETLKKYRFVTLEELDCSKSWLREATNKTLEQILDMLDGIGWVFSSEKDGVFFVRLSTVSIDYFIWGSNDENLDVHGNVNTPKNMNTKK